MLRFLNLSHLFLGCIFLLSINSKNTLPIVAEEFVNVEVNGELKKGNFLIGLEQYLGGKNDIFSKDKKITFAVDKGYLNLVSHNGINHKSKTINITWKDIPLKKPYTPRRFVFGPYASYESAQKKASNFIEKGFKATIAYPKHWEVWIPFEDNISNYAFEDKLSKKTKKSKITPFLSSEFILQKLEGPIYISADEEIKINGTNYGKNFYLVQDLYGTWTLIQRIKFDDYLKGVLPYEIGANSPLEALKAQAVIARTWGIYNSERFNMDKYHLCVTTQCQVYKPPKAENKKVKRAIEETSNLIITYRKKPINSFYHGSNGGISANSGESWQIADNSYFKPAIDGSKSLNKSLTVPIRTKAELNHFLNFDTEKFYGSNHSLFRWEKKISSLNIVDHLIKNKLIESNDTVLDINVLERGISGRATKLEIRLKKMNKPIILVKDDIRRILSFLPSNLFIINKLNDNLWLFRGGGFGHGVGLSQSGAIEMAELGFSYQQILNHYYKGTKLQKIEILSQ